MRIFPSCRGQNIIEYLLLATAVMLILMVGVLRKNGPFVEATNSVLYLTGRSLETQKGKIQFCTPGCPACETLPCGVSIPASCGQSCGTGCFCASGLICSNDVCIEENLLGGN